MPEITGEPSKPQITETTSMPEASDIQIEVVSWGTGVIRHGDKEYLGNFNNNGPAFNTDDSDDMKQRLRWWWGNRPLQRIELSEDDASLCLEESSEELSNRCGIAKCR